MHSIGKDQSETIRAQKTILWAGIIILLIKAGAWLITGSNAILSDALESVINVLAAGLALFSLSYSARPADSNHPYGHGKIEFVTSGIEGGLILATGLIIIAKAIYNLIHPIELQSLELGTYISGGAGMINYLLAMYLLRVGKKTNSIVLRAESAHLKSDAYSSAGLILGLMVILLTDWVWMDNLIAIAFGLLIIVSGFKIIKESLSGIMDEADATQIEQVVGIIKNNRRENWIDLHDFRLMRFGNEIHIDAHMRLPHFLSFQEAHEENVILERIVQNEMGAQVEFFIHSDPCKMVECTWCIHTNCPSRKYVHDPDLGFIHLDKGK